MAGDLRIEMVFNRAPEIKGRARYQAARVVAKAAYDVEHIAKRSMEAPKHGRTYVRGGRIHVASAPGEAPAIDTGNLHNATVAVRMNDLEWHVAALPEYASILEVTLERPFLGPAVDAVRPGFERAMRSILE